MRSIFPIVLLTACCIISCKNKENSKQENSYDSPKKGVIHISVEESFKPVIAEQIKVYESSYPNAKIIAHYKSEVECLKDLQKDSIRMVIVARGLTRNESKFFESKLNYRPQYDVLAYDAVSVITNAQSTDSVYTLKDLQQLLSGKIIGNKQVVVDGNNATATVRYLMDSVLRGETFGTNVKAVSSSKAVVEYVAQHVNAIGFVGFSWIGNYDDPEQIAYLKKIKYALVECKLCKDETFAKPSPSTIMYRQYSLVRPLFFILKENSTGLGTGFVNFMSLERGQLIFRRSYLVPAKMNFQIRKGNISER